MLTKLLTFEIRYHVRQATFLITALIFFAFGIAANKGGFGSELVHKNSAFVHTTVISLLSLFSIFASTLFCANVVMRDSLFRIEAVIFTTAITRIQYYLVRFTGLVLAVFSLLILLAAGLWTGAVFNDVNDLGPFRLINYVHPLLVFGFPNVLFASAMLFGTAMLTKNVRAIYSVGVLLFILYMVASIVGNSALLATSTHNNDGGNVIATLIDPFGLSSFFETTRKWGDAQRNHDLFPVAGLFLWNRILWILMSLTVLVICYKLFHFRVKLLEKKARKQSNIKVFATPIPYRPVAVSPFGVWYQFSTFRSQLILETSALVKHIPFMVMMALWVFFFAVELKDTLFSGVYGIHNYPTTGIIVEEIRSIKFGLILIIFYGAEVLTREKTANMQELVYGTPVQNRIMLGAKMTTLFLLVFLLVTINIGIGISMQLTHNYFNLELPTYLSLYYFSAFPMLLFTVLVVFVQNMSRNKYVGMLLSMVVVFLVVFAERFGLEHYLFRFATTPDLQFSTFNGFGYYVRSFNWYMLYWLGMAGILAIATIALWQRNGNLRFFERVKMAGTYLYRNKGLLLVAIAVWMGSGAFIYRETNLVQRYMNKNSLLQWRIDYEKKYSFIRSQIQPEITGVKTKVDLFPDQQRYVVRGSYELKNSTSKDISTIWVRADKEVSSFRIVMNGSNASPMDKRFNTQQISLAKPMKPGSTSTLQFEISVNRNGFTPFNNENSVVSNGSYIELEKYLPQFGFDTDILLTDSILCRRSALPESIPEIPVDSNYHLVDYETLISTAKDQYIVTVGKLKKTWVSGERRFFWYKTMQPVNTMFALSSARYAQKSQLYKGVSLRIYYHPEEKYNLQMMMKGMQDALDYGNTNFGAYNRNHLTLAAIPQYRGAATAYPGTIFSAERINFLGNFSGKEKVNHSYAITVHETAHQWWANQISPAPVAGADLLTESLAKYTEAMVIEKNFGKEYLSHYLKADQNMYFVMRGGNEKELPLTGAFNQNYVHYQKGGLVFYAVKEAIGEKTLNNVLKTFITNFRAPNKRPTASALVNEILKVSPEHQKRFIQESFQGVFTYDLGVKILSARKQSDGRYLLNIEVDASRLSAIGAVTVPDMDVDLAIYSHGNRSPFYLQKHRLYKRKNTFSIIVNSRPERVAVDPFAYLLDQNLSNNTMNIVL